MWRTIAVYTLGLAVVVSPLPRVCAATEAALTQDGARVLLSKDVGAERWAITHNFDEDGTVTGNVFFPGGGDPQFLWCEDITVGDGDLLLRCLGADLCTSSPCAQEDWSLIAEVPIPGSFFQPETDVEWKALGEVTLPSSFFAPGGGDRESGTQVTPDGQRVLINKDVGGDRWAITRNLTDGTVTGNVFSSGDSPDFLWCQDVSVGGDPSESTYACSIAQAVQPPCVDISGEWDYWDTGSRRCSGLWVDEDKIAATSCTGNPLFLPGFKAQIQQKGCEVSVEFAVFGGPTMHGKITGDSILLTNVDLANSLPLLGGTTSPGWVTCVLGPALAGDARFDWTWQWEGPGSLSPQDVDREVTDCSSTPVSIPASGVGFRLEGTGTLAPSPGRSDLLDCTMESVHVFYRPISE